MIINTNEMEHDFETLEVDGLVLINPREIGISVAHEMLDNDTIWECDIYNNVYEYLSDIISIATDTVYDILEENQKKIK